MNNQSLDQDPQRSGICNLCGRSDFRTIYDFQKYRLVACKDCSLHFLFPPISTSELKDIYSKEYYLSPDSNLYGYSNYQKDVDLIEHLADPRMFFREVNRILKPGGVFELTTPDISSLPSRIMRRRWMGIKSREHLFFFSKKTLGSGFLGWAASLVRPLLPSRFYVNPYDILHVTARKHS